MLFHTLLFVASFGRLLSFEVIDATLKALGTRARPYTFCSGCCPLDHSCMHAGILQSFTAETSWTSIQLPFSHIFITFSKSASQQKTVWPFKTPCKLSLTRLYTLLFSKLKLGRCNPFNCTVSSNPHFLRCLLYLDLLSLTYQLSKRAPVQRLARLRVKRQRRRVQ